MIDMDNEMKLIKCVISRIAHDLINPLGAMSMMMDESLDSGMIRESLNDSISSLEIIRCLFSDNLMIDHAHKISSKHIENVKWDFSNNNQNDIAMIMLILSIIMKQKHQEGVIFLSNKNLEIKIDMNEEEVDALNLSENSLSSYSSYVYLMALICKKNDYKIEYKDASFKINFSA